MFCNKCGTQIPDDVKFCSVCGNKIEAVEEIKEPAIEKTIAEQQAPTVETSAVEAPVVASPIAEAQPINQFDVAYGDTVPLAPVKPKKHFNWKPLVIVASCLAVVGIVIGVFFDYISNFTRKLFLNPTQYYASVEKDSVSTLFDGINKSMVNLDDFKMENELKLSVSKDFADLLKEADVDIDLNDTIIKLGANINKKNDKMSVSVNAGGEKDSVELGSAVLDMTEGEAFGNVPFMSEDNIELDVGEADEALEIINSVVTEDNKDAVLKYLEKYIGVYIENLAEFEETTDKLEVNGISANYTLLSAEITQENVLNATLATLKAFSEDDKAIEYISNNILKEFDISESDLRDVIDEAIEAIEDTEADDDTVIEYKVWVDAKGKIVGRESKTVNADEEIPDAITGFYTVSSGGKHAVQYIVETADVKVELIGQGKLRGNTVKEGEYILTTTYGEESYDVLKISVDHFDISKPAKAQMDAKFSITVSEDVLDKAGAPAAAKLLIKGVAIEFEIERTNKETYFKVALTSSGNELISISLDTTKGGSGKISIPKEAVDVEDFVGDIDDPDDILDSLKDELEKAGLDLDLIEDLGGALSGLDSGYNYRGDYESTEKTEYVYETISPDYSGGSYY